MSENIKVSEVSDILRKQLEGINANVQLDEIGTVLQVSDGVVRIYGLRNAEANELLEFDNGIKAIVMNLEEDNVVLCCWVRRTRSKRIRREAYQTYRLHPCRRGHAGTCDRPAGRTARRQGAGWWRTV